MRPIKDPPEEEQSSLSKFGLGLVDMLRDYLGRGDFGSVNQENMDALVNTIMNNPFSQAVKEATRPIWAETVFQNFRPVPYPNAGHVLFEVEQALKGKTNEPQRDKRGRYTISEEAYPEMEDFYSDVAKAYQEELRSLAERGASYVQLDDTNLAYLCDPKMKEVARQRGEDPDALPRRYAQLINAAIADRPADLRICVHLCRGNFKSAWVAEGGYEPVAEVLSNELDVDGYFLEYDDERSGDFAPLRHVPKNKTVVLGLVTTKLQEMETKDELKQRIEEAARYMPLEQMALSPQCGFSSTVHGNDIAFDAQAAKLRLVTEVAQEVWGSL